MHGRKAVQVKEGGGLGRSLWLKGIYGHARLASSSSLANGYVGILPARRGRNKIGRHKKPAQVAGFPGAESLMETFRYCYMVPEGDWSLPYNPWLADGL